MFSETLKDIIVGSKMQDNRLQRLHTFLSFSFSFVYGTAIDNNRSKGMFCLITVASSQLGYDPIQVSREKNQSGFILPHLRVILSGHKGSEDKDLIQTKSLGLASAQMCLKQTRTHKGKPFGQTGFGTSENSLFYSP